MKKIGVISEIQVDGHGTRNIIYKNSSDEHTYITHLAISVLEGDSLKRIIPKYNNREILFLGTPIEYDEVTGSINEISFFNNLTEDERKELEKIYNKFLEKLEELKNRVISRDNLYKYLKYNNLFNTDLDLENEIFVRIILDNIRDYLTVRDWMKKGKRKVKLND